MNSLKNCLISSEDCHLEFFKFKQSFNFKPVTGPVYFNGRRYESKDDFESIFTLQMSEAANDEEKQRTNERTQQEIDQLKKN